MQEAGASRGDTSEQLQPLQAQPADLTSFSASRSPLRKSTLREYSFSSSGAGLLLESENDGDENQRPRLTSPRAREGPGAARPGMPERDSPRVLLQLPEHVFESSHVLRGRAFQHS